MRILEENIEAIDKIKKSNPKDITINLIKTQIFLMNRILEFLFVLSQFSTVLIFLNIFYIYRTSFIKYLFS